MKPIALVSCLLFLFSIYEPAKSFAFARTTSGIKKHTHGRYLIDNMSDVMNSCDAKNSINDKIQNFIFISGNKRSDAAKIEFLSVNHAKPVPLEDFVRKYIIEALPEGLPSQLPHFEEFEAKQLKELMSLQTPVKKPNLPVTVHIPTKSRQKRYLKTPHFKPDRNAVEYHVHNRLIQHNPSLLPYAREIQNDLLLFLLYMKIIRMPAIMSNGSNFEEASTNRNKIKQGFNTFLFFIRDTLAKDNSQYHPEVKQIKNDVVGALRRLGLVDKRQNIFK